MMKSSSGRGMLGKSVLGATLAALCTMMVACSGGGSGSGTNGAPLGSGFLPNSSQTGSGVTPQITNLDPSLLFPGEIVTITGTGFGNAQLDTSRVRFTADNEGTFVDGGTVAASTDWTNTKIRIAVPTTAVTGPVQIVLNFRTASELVSNAPVINVKRAFDPDQTPKVIFINPAQGQFVGQDTPITVIFDRPILLSSITGNPTASSAFSLTSVNKPNASPNPATETKNAEGVCERPDVCDLRSEDLIKCSCSGSVTVLGVDDISADLRATPRTAFRIRHSPFQGRTFLGANMETRFVADKTIVISVNNTIRSDGSLNPDGSPRSVAVGNVPSTGEFRYFFVN